MTDPIIEDAVGVIDGVNRAFQTTTAYHPGTLWIFLNLNLIPKVDDDQSPVELGGKDFELPIAPEVNDRLHVWYHTGPPTPGAFLPPPRAAQALVLTPSPSAAVELRPHPASVLAEEEPVSMTPRPASAIELAPEPVEAIDLKPKPVRAEEV